MISSIRRASISPLLIQRILFWFVVAAIGFMFIIHPRAWDDYWFLSGINAHSFDENWNYSYWNGIIGCIRDHYTYDNSRIGNTLAILAVTIPKWCTSVLTAIIFGIGYNLLLKLSQTKSGNLAQFTLTTLCLLFFPTWYDQFFCTPYQFNYTWSMTILLWAIYTFLNDKRQSIIKCILIGLLLGSWHESFAVAGFVGMMTVIISKKQMKRSDRWILIAAIAVGGIWHIIFPAWNCRINREVGLHETSFTHLIFCWGYLITLALWLVCLCRKKWQSLALDNMVLITISGGAIVMCAVITSGLERSANPAMDMACAAFPILIFGMFPGLITGSIYKKIVISALWIFIIVHLATASYYSVRNYAADKQLQNILKSNPTPYNAYFLPFTPKWEAPILLFGKPNTGLFDFDSYDMYIQSVYNGTLHSPIKPIPDVLRGYRDGLGRLVDSITGARVYENLIVAPESNYLKGAGNAGETDYGVMKDFSQFKYLRFIGADNKKYVYLYARRSVLASAAKLEVQSIKIYL